MKNFDAAAFPFPIHSVTVVCDGKVLQDDCFAPYEKGQMHRMFSITKSFCSMAIGALIAEEKLSLSDRITDFFPEYVPENADVRLLEMTIGDMLTMRTCHKATTYKVNMKENWVQSFFITPPDHTPGTFFKYDTSSSHVLAALVKKLTGKGVLDYLRPVFLNAIGFSESAYILTDPFGCEMGGSGLVCRPEDLVAVSSFLLDLLGGKLPESIMGGSHEVPDSILHSNHEMPDSVSDACCNVPDSVLQGSHEVPDSIKGGSYGPAFWSRFAAYMQEAVSCLVPTIAEGQTLDEQQGYGRMFWRLRTLSEDESAFMMYGMGGQYCVFYPERRAIFVTTADSQNIKGGHQYILDEIRVCALTLPKFEEKRLPEKTAARKIQTSGDEVALAGNTVSASSKKSEPAHGTYILNPNPAGLTSFTLSEEELAITEEGLAAPFIFRFGEATGWRKSEEAKYGQTLFSKKRLLEDGSLFVDVQILGSCTGSIRFMIKTKDSRAFLYARKVEETCFNEFTGFFEGGRTK